MSIIVKYLEENEIMSSYSPNVKQNNITNCVMLELNTEVVNHAREVADKLNKKYYENGCDNRNGYIDLFSVLEEMLNIQLETEYTEGFEEEPFNITVYSKLLPYVDDVED